jgi:hypothetical protein
MTRSGHGPELVKLWLEDQGGEATWSRGQTTIPQRIANDLAVSRDVAAAWVSAAIRTGVVLKEGTVTTTTKLSLVPGATQAEPEPLPASNPVLQEPGYPSREYAEAVWELIVEKVTTPTIASDPDLLKRLGRLMDDNAALRRRVDTLTYERDVARDAVQAQIGEVRGLRQTVAQLERNIQKLSTTPVRDDAAFREFDRMVRERPKPGKGS